MEEGEGSGCGGVGGGICKVVLEYSFESLLTRSLHSKGAAFNSLHCICLIWIGKIPALLLFNFL